MMAPPDARRDASVAGTSLAARRTMLWLVAARTELSGVLDIVRRIDVGLADISGTELVEVQARVDALAGALRELETSLQRVRQIKVRFDE